MAKNLGALSTGLQGFGMTNMGMSMFDTECLCASEQGFGLSNCSNNVGQLFRSVPS